MDRTKNSKSVTELSRSYNMKSYIFWLIFILVGVIGWFISVIFSALTFGKFGGVANFFAALAMFGLIATLVLSLVKLFKRKK